MLMRFPGGLRKALTLSYDDGVEQDRRLIEILDKHGIRCTFNLNSGCWAKEGHVYPAGTIHRRMPLSQVKETYDTARHEVAVHCLTHASLPELPPERMTHEILMDRVNLEHIFGGFVRGAAYPFGTYSDEAVQALESCGICYCRTVNSSRHFGIPQDWLRLFPTCHHDDPMLDEMCDRFLNDPSPFGNLLFYLWGHSYEFEANDNWDRIERFCERMGGRDDIWYATNIQVYEYVAAYKRLVFTADGSHVHNPTDMTVWMEKDDRQVIAIAPGETVQLA